MSARYADPYVPNPVPQGDSMAELQRFLADELQRISIAGQQTPVLAAYGGIVIQAAAAPQSIGPVPVIVEGWDGFIPEEPNRITIGEFADSLIALESGTYHFSTQITANTTAGRVYRITLAVKEPGGAYQLAPVFAEYDTSNQSNSVNMVFSAIVDVPAGNEYAVFVNANLAGSDFTPQSGVFQMFRISELRKVL